MRKILFVLVSTLFFISCRNDNELKEKELQLKERELQVRENELIQKAKEDKKSIHLDSAVKTVKKKKLRYLRSDDFGLIALFSDGTAVGCKGCNLNIPYLKSIYGASVNAKYRVLSDGSIILYDGKHEISQNPLASDNWVMVDYIWKINSDEFSWITNEAH
jgi:hypothetical protein